MSCGFIAVVMALYALHFRRCSQPTLLIIDRLLQPMLIPSGKVLSKGKTYTHNGPLTAAIA